MLLIHLPIHLKLIGVTLMKNPTKLTLALLLTLPLSLVSYVAEAQSPQAMEMQHKGMGMGGMMGGMTEAEQDQHMKAMQEHMLMMHDLSNQILTEKDPTKKQQLKNQQFELMKAHHAQMMSAHHPMK
jgi:hypothetical protein